MEDERKKSTDRMRLELDRRQFLRMTAVGGSAAAVLLAGCAVPTEAPAGGDDRRCSR